MKNFLDKFFSRSKNLDYISQNLKQITLTTPANKIFEAINNFSEKSEIRYVGGCVRKVIKKENVDDIDLATNLTPLEVCEASQTSRGVKFVARSISSTFSFFITFLTHPPTYLISLFSEKLLIASKILFAGVVKVICFKF